MSRGIGGHHRSALSWQRSYSDDWLTPHWIIKELGPFDLDPCTPKQMPWRTAKRMLTKEDDGLAAEWKGRVWLNPPYGRQTAKWLEKMATHNRGIALVFARTETEMFHEWVWPHASAIIFLRGRLSFVKADGLEVSSGKNRRNANAGGPSVLIGYGHEEIARLRDSYIPGRFLDLASGPALSIPGRCTER